MSGDSPSIDAYGREAFQALADQAAKANDIPTSIYSALVGIESAWNPYAVSSAGAIGLSQLMPGTAESLGVDAYDPAQNLNGGASYLSSLYKQFGNWRDALAAYNAGPGNLKAGYSYADKVLGQAGDEFSGPSNMPGDTGNPAIDNANGSTVVGDFILNALKSSGLVILGAILVILGVVLLVWKGGAEPAKIPV